MRPGKRPAFVLPDGEWAKRNGEYIYTVYEYNILLIKIFHH
jgi:hypothetical protein